MKHCFFFTKRLYRERLSTERQSDKIAIYLYRRGSGKSIDYSKFAIRDFRPRARRTGTSLVERGRRGPAKESVESEAKQKWIRDFV